MRELKVRYTQSRQQLQRAGLSKAHHTLHLQKTVPMTLAHLAFPCCVVILVCCRPRLTPSFVSTRWGAWPARDTQLPPAHRVAAGQCHA